MRVCAWEPNATTTSQNSTPHAFSEKKRILANTRLLTDLPRHRRRVWSALLSPLAPGACRRRKPRATGASLSSGTARGAQQHVPLNRLHFQYCAELFFGWSPCLYVRGLEMKVLRTALSEHVGGSASAPAHNSTGRAIAGRLRNRTKHMQILSTALGTRVQAPVRSATMQRHSTLRHR